MVYRRRSEVSLGQVFGGRRRGRTSQRPACARVGIHASTRSTGGRRKVARLPHAQWPVPATILKRQSRTRRIMDAMLPQIAWLSWRQLSAMFSDTHDLHVLAKRLELTYFSGIPSIAPVNIDWSFGSPSVGWSWSVHADELEWTFDRQRVTWKWFYDQPIAWNWSFAK